MTKSSNTSNNAAALLRIEGITKTFGHTRALSDVSFSIRPGEVLGLIGPNGAGKTTLFECLTGVLPADSGTISRSEKLIPLRDRSSFLFYLPDGITPWPAQSVRWMLDFIVGFFGGPASLRDDVIQRLDLRPLLNSPIGTLSKGQRKRALLAAGLLTPQPVLLADEPFDGLDLRQTREVAQALRTYAASGRTLFLSIHQITDAARVCDRFVLLSGGRVRGEGTVGELSAAASSKHTGESPNGLEEVFLALT
ncbi:MAG: ABC transporter ATP-binding protein [Acidobacteria bacterium]|nr:ABC transporter ATP-binding protein [Acidobacteriota bacterium]